MTGRVDHASRQRKLKNNENNDNSNTRRGKTIETHMPSISYIVDAQ